MIDEAVTAELDRHFAEDLEVSEEIDLDRWDDRGVVQRAKEVAVDAFDHKL
jgi:cardiolipin synthase